MNFIEYLIKTFAVVPKDLDSFIANPVLPVFTLCVLFLLITGRFRIFFVMALVTLIFTAGLFYGVINPIGGTFVSSLIFAASTLISVLLVIFKILLKLKQ